MKRLGILSGAAVLCVSFAFAHATSTRQSAGSKEDLSVMAGNMLNDTKLARTDIKNGNKSSALQHVERAEAELRDIQGRAHGATIIPVYQEFVSVSMLQPVLAEQQSRREKSSQQPTVVHQVAGDYTDVAVNTQVAQVNLEAAKTALQAGNLNRADQALADVQQGVSAQSIEADMPLAQARENMILARAAAEKHHYTEVHAALAAASRALANYSSNSSRPHAAEAQSLQQQIDSYDKTLQQNHSDAVAKINGWWNTTTDWTPYRPADQMSAAR